MDVVYLMHIRYLNYLTDHTRKPPFLTAIDLLIVRITVYCMIDLILYSSR